jgi:hypothetical protein
VSTGPPPAASWLSTGWVVGCADNCDIPSGALISLPQSPCPLSLLLFGGCQLVSRLHCIRLSAGEVVQATAEPRSLQRLLPAAADGFMNERKFVAAIREGESDEIVSIFIDYFEGRNW